MEWNSSHGKLLTELATLYDTADSARIVVLSTGLDPTKIKFEGNPTTIWFDILSYAIKREKVIPIIEYASKEFPNRTDLREALEIQQSTAGENRVPSEQEEIRRMLDEMLDKRWKEMEERFQKVQGSKPSTADVSPASKLYPPADLAPFEHGYAVVIGVDDTLTERVQKLPSVARDVQALYDVLVHPKRCAYRPENVKLLIHQASTAKNILDSLSWLQEKVTADPQASAIIYYSGHAYVDKDSDQFYLIPYDFEGINHFEESAMKGELFSDMLADIQAPRMLMIFDCSTSARMIHMLRAGGQAVFANDLAEQGRAILASSADNQQSYVRNDGKMSLFTYHLIEALTGHGSAPDDTVVYVTDVMSWVARSVQKSAEQEGRRQTPVMCNMGDFPIARLLRMTR